MINLPNVELISTTSTHVFESINALRYSSRDIKFKSIKLFSHEKPKLDFDFDYEFIKIPYVSSRDDYTKFKSLQLHKYLETEYFISVEHDGFIINPHLWKDEFLNYDYIGAPWRNFYNRVGNGGCHLVRSEVYKRLPNLVHKYHDEFRQNYHSPNLFVDDVFISNFLYIKNEGINYAPIDLAIDFSMEHRIPEYPNRTPDNSFGFHGRFHKTYIERRNQME